MIERSKYFSLYDDDMKPNFPEGITSNLHRQPISIDSMMELLNKHKKEVHVCEDFKHGDVVECCGLKMVINNAMPSDVCVIKPVNWSGDFKDLTIIKLKAESGSDD